MEVKMRYQISVIFTVAILLLTAVITLSGQTCVPVPADAISWWAAENNALDRFDRNNAVLQGDTVFVQGKVGQAFSFDGSGDYAQVATAHSLPVGAAPRTVELWFKAPATPGESGLFQYGTASGGQMFGLITSGNAPGRLYFYGHSADLPANTVIQPNTWYHGAVTYDGTTVKIYINGQVENSAAIGLNTVIDTNGITIGYRPGGSSWNGQIDEPTIYDRALSDNEVAAIYNAGVAGKCLAQCAALPSETVGWWPGNATSNDIVNNNNGTLVNGVSFTAGKVDQAFSFDQSAQQYVSLPLSAANMLNNSNGSIAAWVRPSAIGEYDMVTAFGSGNPGEAVGFAINNGNVRIYHHTDPFDWQTAIPVSINTWTHLAYTWDGTTERIYKNGTLVDSRARNFSYVTGYARIGFGFINDASVFFPGQIDEVAIFNRTLAATEISTIYQADSAGLCPRCASAPAGLNSWWPGENNGNDIVGSNNGTLMNGVSFAGGKVGQAFRFDGVDDLVRANNATHMDGGPQATYDAWVYPTAVPNVGEYLGIIGVGDSTVPTWTTQQCRVLYWRTADSPSDHARFYADCGLDNNEHYVGRYSSRNYPINQWSYVAVVFNRGNLNIFVNGAQDDGELTGPGGTVINTMAHKFIWIGAQSRNDGSVISTPFNGKIDEPGISSQALSPNEVRSVFNSGRTGKCSSCATQSTGAISWWRGEDNVNDALGGNYGVLLGGATFAPGLVGRAFSFNGSTAAVRIPDSPTLDVTTDFTLGAWIKPATIPNYPNGALVMSKVGPIGNLNGYQITVTNISGINRIWCSFNTGGNNWPQHIASGGSVPVAEWTYISCTYDHNTLAVFQNGEQVGTASVGPVTVANTTSDLKLGSDDVAQQFYNGLIDEPMIFGRALTAAELRTTYEAGSLGICSVANPTQPTCGAIPPGLISWWRAEGNALDRRKAHHGTLLETTTFGPGKTQNAFIFAAGNEGVDVGTWFNLQTFSIEMWVKPNNGQIQYSNIIDNNHRSDPLRSWVLEDLNTGNVFQWYSADFPAGTNILFELVPDTWQHIVITRGADRVTRGYLNRSLVGSVTTASDIPYDGTQLVRIGNWVSGNRAFNGLIDEVSIYDRPLTVSQIAAIYDADTYGKCAGSQTRADLDGDMWSDLSIFRPTGTFGAEWWWLKSTGGNGAVQFGLADDTIVTRDYTGDGKSDIAFWRPTTGLWYILRSEDFSFYAFPFGSPSDIPVPSDYDGDGKADATVFRPSTSVWYINRSTGGTGIVQFGTNGDKPIGEDFDGDGKADVGVFRPNGTGGAEWWIAYSSGGVFATQFGQPADKAVPADYTGDGKADVAYWDPTTGYWFVLRSNDLSYYAFPFGAAGDLPVPADYDGDARDDAGVFRPSNGNWYLNRSTAGITIQQFGQNGDVPVPNAFVR